MILHFTQTKKQVRCKNSTNRLWCASAQEFCASNRCSVNEREKTAFPTLKALTTRKIVCGEIKCSQFCLPLACRYFMKDIETKEDVETLVNSFYRKARTHDLLGPVFASRIADDQWPDHLQRMYAFWNAILFAEKGFEGNPMQKHLALPIADEHFSHWLILFNQTIDETFCGPKAEEARKRAASIAQIMASKINLQNT